MDFPPGSSAEDVLDAEGNPMPVPDDYWPDPREREQASSQRDEDGQTTNGREEV